MATSPFQALDRVLDALDRRKPTRLVGMAAGFRGLTLARAAWDDDAEGPVVYVAPDERTARATAADVAFFAGVKAPEASTVEGPILVFPEEDVSPYADASPDPRNVALRMAALSRLRDGDDPPKLVVTSLRALSRRSIPPELFAERTQTWTRDDEIERDEAVQFLLDAGYQRSDVVEDPGTFSVRGGVTDVYVPRRRFPVRVEWFGDEIERMRLFDPDTQRSLRGVESVVVHPVRETLVSDGQDLRLAVLKLGDELEVPSSKTRQVIDNLDKGLDFFGREALVPLFHPRLVPLWDYLPEEVRWYLDDPEALVGLAERVDFERQEGYGRVRSAKSLAAPPDAFYLDRDELQNWIVEVPVVGERLDLYDPDRKDRRRLIRMALDSNLALRKALEAARGTRGGELLRPVVEHVRALGREGDGELVDPWDVVMVAPNQTHAERLTSLLRGYGLKVETPRGEAELPEPLVVGPDALDGRVETRVRVVAGSISQGFRSEADRTLVLSEAEIFGTVTRKHRTRRKRVGVASLSQLSVGDYVVHVMHGVGRYDGLTKLSVGGVPADFVQVEYSGKDKLYLPVYRISEIERYSAADGKQPKLDKMGGQTFAAKTRKVQADVRQMAEELLQIYAQREAMEGHAYPERGDMYAQFEATFPFEETPDQMAAIDAVQDDLTRPSPMDRLVCGDVGFGKTEVALRAAFRVAAGGKQVAVLAPTTVLVQQHYLTFSDRMGGFPMNVGVLNRFTPAKERKRVVEGIKDGSIDVVVGTHRLLSRDVRFKDLGLVIVDEEQRFGVAQKERFKKLKTKVDVLTLSATPIPRTLHLSLLGLREISLITTPPVDRLAVRTHVTRAGDTVVEEGIRRELARGGQVFYVVPRVLGIEEHARRIRELVPEARVLVAHGQMPGEMLEKTMVEFVEHEADVLVSTTIVESGLDIPRANTMFIHRADLFGLGQLYQLRGRIGRSKLRAYCYLMVNSLEKLAPDSRRRLEAIQRHSELGSGFNVASQDLEIRGAGDVLGKRQSGSIQAVGFEAYSRIVAEAVAELRGDPIVHESDPELAFDVPAFLPDDYVEDVGQRLDLYRRLSSGRDGDEVRDVMAEIHDRYGEMPSEARNFGLMMACKTYGRRLGAQTLELKGPRLAVRLGPHTPLDPRTATQLADMTQGRFRLSGTDRVIATVGRDGMDTVGLLEACEGALSELLTLARVR